LYNFYRDIIGCIDSIEIPRIVGNDQQCKSTMHFINFLLIMVPEGIQVVAWNDDVDRVEQLIRIL